MTRSECIRQITMQYLSTIDKTNPPAPADVSNDIVTACNVEIDLQNAVVKPKMKSLSELTNSQIADILMSLHHVCRISLINTRAVSSDCIVSIYDSSDGIYHTDDVYIKNLIRRYRYDATSKDVAEVLEILSCESETKTLCNDRDLIAVNNGIFDYKTKQLLQFSPDYVFISKSRVNYNENASNVVIHNDDDNTDWDVESWMNEFSDDHEFVTLLWQILGAIIRPNVRWNKSAWFYAETGNNGKGTLCELMRQLVGEGSYTSISLSDFSKDFMLEPLIGSQAIIVDENDVNCHIDKAANLKAIITNDVIQINRKFKTPIPYQFRGFMVQCLNSYPDIKDKSDSFYRRQLFVPFTKCFTGVERRYIKDTYLHSDEVLEYVMNKVLNMNYYELITPAVCSDAVDEYKTYNDNTRQFLSDLNDELVRHYSTGGKRMTAMTKQFLYDIYVGWYKSHVASAGYVSDKKFSRQINELALAGAVNLRTKAKSGVINAENCNEAWHVCWWAGIDDKAYKYKQEIGTCKVWEITGDTIVA